jgi:hypothetical protein
MSRAVAGVNLDLRNAAPSTRRCAQDRVQGNGADP